MERWLDGVAGGIEILLCGSLWPVIDASLSLPGHWEIFQQKAWVLVQLYTLLSSAQIQAHLLRNTGRKEKRGDDKKGEGMLSYLYMALSLRS